MKMGKAILATDGTDFTDGKGEIIFGSFVGGMIASITMLRRLFLNLCHLCKLWPNSNLRSAKKCVLLLGAILIGLDCSASTASEQSLFEQGSREYAANHF